MILSKYSSESYICWNFKNIIFELLLRREILLRARNPYLTRRLPFIIGSEEFTRNDSLGLVDSSSSEDDEDEDEEDDDDDDDEDEVEVKKVDDEMNSEEEKFVIPKPPIPRTEFTRPQPQVFYYFPLVV